MRIAVFGSTGRTGREICGQAVERNLDVSALARTPLDLSVLMDHMRVIKGDVLEPDRVRRTLEDADAVVCALGNTLLQRNDPIESKGTGVIVSAMEQLGIDRMILISAFGVGDSREMMTPMHEKLLTTVLGPILEDKERQEELLTSSSLDWVVVRPVRLTRKDATGVYRVGEHLAPGLDSSISRGDVAHFALNQLTNDEYLGRAVTIMY